MRLLTGIGRTGLAWSCLALNCWSTPITHPNQAYIFSGESFSPVPGITNITAFAVEGDKRSFAVEEGEVLTDGDEVLAVTRDGRVVASGLPESWLAGEILDPLTNVVAVGLNYTGGAALTADGRVFDFGRPTNQPPGLTNVIAIDVCGQFGDDDLDFKLAVTSDGRVVTWGGFFDPPPSAEIPGVMTAAGGWSHIVALKADGTVVQWDHDNEPAAVAGLSNVVAVAAGGEHSVALKADGTVVAWGRNYSGQVNVPPGLSNVAAITASEDHTLALKSDGTLVAWGEGYFGGSVTPPASLSNVVAIASSGTKNLALVSIPHQSPVLGISTMASNLGRLTITLSGEPNQVYEIETSAELLTWSFVRYVTNQLETASFEVAITNAIKQFFRAK